MARLSLEAGRLKRRASLRESGGVGTIAAVDPQNVSIDVFDNIHREPRRLRFRIDEVNLRPES
jgi:hypothetical protein